MNRQLWSYGAAVVVCALAVPLAHAQNTAVAPTAASVAQTSGVQASRKAMKAADRKLAYAVRKRIEHVKGLDATRIAIVARDGNVTLTGSVPKEEQIEVAVDHAKAVAGVTSVSSRLEVGEIGP
ncbi:BON domain-containing protein [Paraburkholderia sp. RL17-337-BIB-A]|uniref:BON domain-containing protein n=1 Tax=Paraburkholderia sp. RL17-337-BIB-A TaxID=3031636 RepID=UPI0038B90BC5